MPKASARRFHQSNGSRPNGALQALRKHSRVLRHRRAPADCFGANPVASAWGNPARRDPGRAMRTYHEGRQSALKTGTFYFGGNRNFLLWSDSRASIKLASVAHEFDFEQRSLRGKTDRGRGVVSLGGPADVCALADAVLVIHPFIGLEELRRGELRALAGP